MLQDEASFFEINQASEAIDISHRYIAKSNPYLIVYQHQTNQGICYIGLQSRRKRIAFTRGCICLINVGLPPYGNIFTNQEIEIAKRSSSFEREYNLKFAGITGTVFLETKIEEAIKMGDKTDLFKLAFEQSQVHVADTILLCYGSFVWVK